MGEKIFLWICAAGAIAIAIPAGCFSAEKNADCDSIGALAKQLAEARDKGVDEQELLKQSHQNAAGDQHLDSALGRLITMTYNHRELTPDQIQSRVLDGCYKHAAQKSGAPAAKDKSADSDD